MPFLQEVNKIVVECANHTYFNDIPWYSAWEKWTDKRLFRTESIKKVGTFICPNLKYNDRTIKLMIKRIVSKITPGNESLKINNLSDTSIV